MLYFQQLYDLYKKLLQKYATYKLHIKPYHIPV